MADQLSIFHPSGQFGLKENPYGKDVANLELFRALAQHGGFDELQLLGLRPPAGPAEALLAGATTATRLTANLIIEQHVPARAGALLRGSPDLYELAWLRRRTVGDRAYSLMGLVHTVAPPVLRQRIATAQSAPVQPWDAVICTSPSVRDNLAAMFDRWGDWLAERTGGSAPPTPQLPVLPLGVDGAAFAGFADRPQARAAVRARLGLAEADILTLWVGRLSYFEKAFPQAMFKAVQAAARRTGVKVALAMAGWFPSARDRELWTAAARAYAPDVEVSFLDGNDRALRGELWAGADIFMSLVDNIQETFGITPLEAMAAGLPVVASDWDGYSSTMTHGVEAFLIPTLFGPAGGRGDSMALRHVLEVDTYQAYVGTIAQVTAVHVGKTAEALAALIESPDLRRRMGAAGRARIREAFDWPVVARRYHALVDDLAGLRQAAPDRPSRHRNQPTKADPFADFAGFATATLTVDQRLSAVPGVTVADIRRTAELELDQAFTGWRASLDDCVAAFELIAQGRARTTREVLLAFPVDRRRPVELGILWMAKQGFVDWLT